MKRRHLIALVTAGALICALALAGCATSSSDATASSDEKQTIKIGIRGDLVDLLEAVKPDIEAKGYQVEQVVFDDSVQPNVALAEGSIDCNWYQHEPYLESYNASNGTTFKMVEPKSYFPLFAMYSSTWDSPDELPDGATIGLCNDSSNRARGLKLLADYGLITLNEDVAIPTVFDIVDNPHGYTFIEAEMSVLPQSIDDVDAICLAATHMVNAGKAADSYIAASKDAESYAVGFVVREGDEGTTWATDLANAVQSDALATVCADLKKGTLIPSWE